jgi:type VI secretion system secreted protein VgrG
MTSDYVDVRLESSEFPTDDIQVHKVSGTEAISRLFSFDIDVVTLDPGGLDAAAIAGSHASLVLLRSDVEVRRIHGIIVSVEAPLDLRAEPAVYRLRLVPRAFKLSLVETQEVFLKTAVPAILKDKLERVSLGSADVELRLGGDYPERELVIQYKETDLAFVSRLAEHLGISFFFEHDKGVDALVFSDQQASFPKLDPVLLRVEGDQRDVYRLGLKTSLIPAVYAVQDYNYRTPQVELSSVHELADGFAGGVVEYGGHFKTPEEGNDLARVRAEERQVEQRVYTGESDLPGLTAGRRVLIEGPSPVEVLLISVEHEASRPVLTHGSAERHYKNRFRAIPVEHTYRPPRVTPKPRIFGLVNGIIEHGIENGVERWAKIDESGRYWVRFSFDTAEHKPKQSHPIRMIQPHAGTHYGMHFPLKPGTEVLVGFVDGDPDRPLIVGAVYRPDTPSPVTSANATINKLQSESGVIIEIHDA